MDIEFVSCCKGHDRRLEGIPHLLKSSLRRIDASVLASRRSDGGDARKCRGRGHRGGPKGNPEPTWQIDPTAAETSCIASKMSAQQISSACWARWPPTTSHCDSTILYASAIPIAVRFNRGVSRDSHP